MPKSTGSNRHFPGFTSPQYTQVPDALFDELMAFLSGSELKVLLYVIRRTFGFKKDVDNISLNQICNGITTREGEILDKGTGLSQQSVITALKGLVEMNAIVATKRVSRERGNESTTYSLNVRPFSKNLTTPSPKIREGLLQKLETQETVKQQTDIQLRTSKANSQEENDQPTSEETTLASQNLTGKNQAPIQNSRAGESQQPRTGSLHTLSEILEHHKPSIAQPSSTTPLITQAPTPQLKVAVEIISAEFSDTAHLRSNVSQAANLWQASGRSEASFVASLYEARSITRQQRNVRKPMPYFWSTVRDLVGLKQHEAEAATVTPTRGG